VAEKNSKSCDWEMEKGKGGRGAVQVMTLEVYEKKVRKRGRLKLGKRGQGSCIEGPLY
jgi:hypothetical protein